MHKTPLNDFHERMGAKMVEFAGWNMPLLYSGIIEEHQATRNGCTMFDISHMGRIYVSGGDATALLEHLCTRKIDGMELGQSRYSHMCKQDGGILDDLIVSRFAEDRYLVVCNASNRDKIVGWIGSHSQGKDVVIDDQTKSTAMLAIQGPNAAELADELLPDAILKLKRYRFHKAKYIGVDYVCSRTGYTGEDGYELIVSTASGKLLANSIVDPHGAVQDRVTLAGLGARDTLRMEAGMPLYGHELHEDIDSISAGQGWCVNLEKDFIGRDAMARVQEQGPSQTLVGLEIEGKRIARQDAAIEKSGRQIGAVTSGTKSPTLQKIIAMGFVETQQSEVGTELEVDIRGRKTAAKIVPLPFYKRMKKGIGSREKGKGKRE